MNELEKKFYQYLFDVWLNNDKTGVYKVAEDLAEIAEKEFNSRSFDTFLKLKEENTKFKKQLAASREKIVKVLNKYSIRELQIIQHILYCGRIYKAIEPEQIVSEILEEK